MTTHPMPRDWIVAFVSENYPTTLAGKIEGAHFWLRTSRPDVVASPVLMTIAEAIEQGWIPASEAYYTLSPC